MHPSGGGTGPEVAIMSAAQAPAILWAGDRRTASALLLLGAVWQALALVMSVAAVAAWFRQPGLETSASLALAAAVMACAGVAVWLRHRLGPMADALARDCIGQLPDTGDLADLHHWLSRGWPGMVAAGLSAGGIWIVLLVLQPVLAALALVPMLAGVAAIVWFGPMLVDATAAVRQQRAALDGHVRQRISALQRAPAGPFSGAVGPEVLPDMHQALVEALGQYLHLVRRCRVAADVLSGGLLMLPIGWMAWHASLPTPQPLLLHELGPTLLAAVLYGPARCLMRQAQEWARAEAALRPMRSAAAVLA